MDSKMKIIAIVVVAAVVIAGVATVMVMNNGGDKGKLNVDATVTIFGNANNDAYIDSSDVDFIQSIIDKKTTWDPMKNPYADANNDKQIDEKDVELTWKIINNEPAEIYYMNYFNEPQKINYPLKDRKICVTYWQQAEEMAILHQWDNVVVASANVTDRNGLLYDTSKVQTIGSVGSSSINEKGVETILNNKVDLIVATPSASVKATCDALMNDDSRGYHIDVVYLWYASKYCIPTIMTMGILMDAEDEAQAYAEYCYKAENDITSKISEKDMKSSIVICGFEPTSMASRMSSKGGLDVISGDVAGAYYLMNKITKAYHATDVDNWGYCYRSVDWFISNDSLYDVIIDTESGAGFAKVTEGDKARFFTQDEYNARFENSITYFAGTEEYKQGWIVGSTFDFLSGFSGYAMLPVIAAQLYPGQFNMDDAIKNLQYWFDNFTTVKLDVKEVGGYRYTGEKYSTAYSKDSSGTNANGFYSWSPTMFRVNSSYSACTPAFMSIVETGYKAVYGEIPKYDNIARADIPEKYLYPYTDFTSVDGSGKLVIKTFDNTSDGKKEAYLDKTLEFTPTKVISYMDANIDTIYRIMCDYYNETPYAEGNTADTKLWELIPAMTSSVKTNLEKNYGLKVPEKVTIIGTGQEDLTNYCGSISSSEKVIIFMSEYNIRSTNKSTWWDTNTAITSANPNIQFVYTLSNSPSMILSTMEMMGEIIGYESTESMMTKILAEIYVMQKAIDDSGKKYNFYAETNSKKAVASNTNMGGMFTYILKMENIVTGDNLMNGTLSDEKIVEAQPKVIIFYMNDTRSDAECMRVV